MLTQERAEKLSDFLATDPERAQKLFALGAEEALSQINALGNDFTLDEISEFGQELTKAFAQDTGEELDADALDDVAGGGWFTDTFGGAINKVKRTVSGFAGAVGETGAALARIWG